MSFDLGTVSYDSRASAGHPGCWLIPITVEGVNTSALIDTGATTYVTMMGRLLHPKIQRVHALKLQTRNNPWLEGVGSPVPALGRGGNGLWCVLQ